MTTLELLPSIATEGRCSALTAKGSPCGMKPKKGTVLCHAHSLTPEARREQSQRAARASAAVRKQRAQERQERVEEARIEARLGLEHWISVKADERDEEIAEALVARAIADPASRAMGMLLDRHLGRVSQTIDVQSDGFDPSRATEAELLTWLREDGSLD